MADRRTSLYCANLKKKKLHKKIQNYWTSIRSLFSATKIKWILDNVTKAKKTLQ